MIDLRRLIKRSAQYGLALWMAVSDLSAANRPSALLQSRQILIVTTPNWDSVTGTVQRYERHRGGESWQKVGQPIAVVVGKGGMGWGDGAIALPVHAGSVPLKHEGDGKTPAGVFRLGNAFGYALNKPAAWAMPYRNLTPETECVDDRDSKYYNQIVERKNVTPDWKSSEHMRSEGIYYQWGAVVQQNPENKPGDGSCVFLHVSDTSGKGTSGCTAMDKPELELVLKWLKPDDVPLVVEMPIAEYRRVAQTLHLPSQ